MAAATAPAPFRKARRAVSAAAEADGTKSRTSASFIVICGVRGCTRAYLYELSNRLIATITTTTVQWTHAHNPYRTPDNPPTTTKVR